MYEIDSGASQLNLPWRSKSEGAMRSKGLHLQNSWRAGAVLRQHHPQSRDLHRSAAEQTKVDATYLDKDERISVISRLYGSVELSGEMEESYRSLINTAHG